MNKTQKETKIMKTHNKKLCYVVFIAVALALCTTIALCSCTVTKTSATPQDFLAETEVQQAKAFASTSSGGMYTVEAEPIEKGKVDNLIFEEYNIGKIKNCFIQLATNPVYNDEGLSKMGFTKSEITSTTISKGISNSISTTESVSLTESSENTVTWNVSKGGSHTTSAEVSAEVALKSGALSIKAGASTGVSDTVSAAVEAGGSNTHATAQTIANTVSEQINKDYRVDSVVQTGTELSIEHDMSKYERNLWYAYALIKDIEVHQVIAYSYVDKTFYTSYFTCKISGNVGLKLCSSKDLEFDITPEYQLKPIDKITCSDGTDVDVLYPNRTPQQCSECNGASDVEHFGGGCGAESHPYVISSKDHFENIAKVSQSNKFFKLDNSVDLGEWNEPFAFSGKLDGQGNKISYYQNIGAGNKKQYGLFSSLNNATVKRMRIEFNITANKKGTNISVGGLAGNARNNTNISQIYINKNSDMFVDTDGESFVGGIVGYFEGGTIDQCANETPIWLGGRWNYAGGLIGCAVADTNNIIISNCYNIGDVTAQGYKWTTKYGRRVSGGIVGRVKEHSTRKISISKCFNDSQLKLLYSTTNALAYRSSGAIVGDCVGKKGISFSDCYFNSSKTANAAWNSRSCTGITGRADLYGSNSDYRNWDDSIWIFNASGLPILKWTVQMA